MSLRLVFLGSDSIALPLLHWLQGPGRPAVEVVGVYTQPDRPVGRGQQVRPNAIKQWALDHQLPLRQPVKVGPEERDALAAWMPDVALVMAYGHILKDDFIAVPRVGTWNLHTSLLPRYRGASPIQTAVAQGDAETGVSLMRIVRALDAGPVADAERVAIGPLDTAADVEAKLAQACVPLLERCLARLHQDRLTFVEQDHGAATFCRRLTKSDGVLDFSASAAVLAARINGLHPWPGCAIAVSGQPMKLGLADAVEGTGGPGIVAGADAEGLLIGTGAGLLRLRRLQRPGGRMLAATEFLRGFAVPAGTPIPSVPMPPLVGVHPFR